MRIQAGNLKYKKIKYIKDDRLRPTRNIVKKSFFDTILPIIDGCVFLDLFAGVGSVGIEALSRGAKEAIFVDNSFRSIKVIKENIVLSGCEAKSVVVKSDAASFVCNNDIMKRVDIVYMDAPYEYNISDLLEELFLNVNRNAIICVEHSNKKEIKLKFGEFSNIKRRKIGKNILDYFGVVDV